MLSLPARLMIVMSSQDDSYVEPIPHGLHLGSYLFDDSYVEPIGLQK